MIEGIGRDQTHLKRDEYEKTYTSRNIKNVAKMKNSRMETIKQKRVHEIVNISVHIMYFCIVISVVMITSPIRLFDRIVNIDQLTVPLVLSGVSST